MTEHARSATADDEHGLVARYFDGELDSEGEAAALAHLATCAACQRELGDLIGLSVALGREPTAASTPAPADVARPASTAPVDELARRRRSRMRLLAIAAPLAVAAAVVVLWITRPTSEAPVKLALAATRSTEPRFSAEPFAGHRPYSVARGSAPREELSLEVLAGLERARRFETLAAAHATTGELARARAVLTTLPPSAARDADLAAVELLAGAPEAALEAADRALARDPASLSARWNRALAAREIGLASVAAEELEAVARAAEPGWAQEATDRARSLRSAMAQRLEALKEFTRRAHAMIDRLGPPLTAADVTARPGFARIFFHDALRGATNADEARALSPLADALDAAAGTAHARQAVERVAAASFATRAPLARQYRDLALGRSSDGGAALLAKLDRLGTEVDDLRLGAIVFAGQQLARHAEYERLLAGSNEPWFDLVLPLNEAQRLLNAGREDRAEAVLLEGLARCDERRWGQRCAMLASKLGVLYMTQGRDAEADAKLEVARNIFRATSAVDAEDSTLASLAEVRRSLGRHALAAAIFREVIARQTDRTCEQARFATLGLALISVYQRAALPEVELAIDACGAPPDALAVAIVVDLALIRRRPEDFDRARKWIAAARAAGDAELTGLAEIADARLQSSINPVAAADRLRAALPRVPDKHDVGRGFRAWTYQTLIDLAARRSAWADVFQLAAEETGRTAPTTCAVVVSRDDTRGTAAALGPTGAATGERHEVELPSQLSSVALVGPSTLEALRGCAQVAVIARPPLHGRADLLPPELPWSFTGPPVTHPAALPPVFERAVFIGDSRPPPSLGLPALAPMRAPADAIALREHTATPSAALAELTRATYAELHVHGQVDLAVADASFLALSPDADKSWALTSAMVRKTKLQNAPIIVLAACRAAATPAPYEHKRWSLPDAFLAAGARAVIAPTVEIPDDDAAAFFADLRARLASGQAPAAALAATRAAYTNAGSTWAKSVILFE